MQKLYFSHPCFVGECVICQKCNSVLNLIFGNVSCVSGYDGLEKLRADEHVVKPGVVEAKDIREIASLLDTICAI